MGNSNKIKKQQAKSEDGEILDCDVLFGMKSICQFLGRSESTIIKFIREYDDFPVHRENGSGYAASRSELNKWFRAYARGEK